MGTKKDFIKKIVKSADFWVRVDAISTGFSVGLESVLLGIGATLPAVPFMVGALGMLAAVGLGSCAAYSLYIGATGTWDFVKEKFHETFRAGKPVSVKPDKRESTPVDRLAHHKRIYPLAKKIAETKLGKKLVNSRLGKMLRYGLTQPQRDLFMVSLNTKGSLFVGVAAVTYIVMHTLALPVLTLGAAVTAPVAIAALWACKSTFDITCSTKVLIKNIRERRRKKKEAKQAQGQQPAPVPAPSPAPAVPVPAAAPAFEKAAAPADAKPETPPAPPVITPPPPRPPAR
jgi:hypothetical protein